MFCLYYLFHTIWNIPYQGLGLELSPDYQDRNRLFGIRAFIAFLGLTGSFFLISVVKARGVFADERQAVAILTGCMALLSVVLFIIPLFKVRENPEFSKKDRIPLIPGVRRALRNRPFRLIMFTYIMATIANAMPPLLNPYFTKYVLVLGDQWRAIFAGVYTLAGFFSIPLWVILSRFIEKKHIWMVSATVGILSGFFMFTVGEGQIAKMIILEIFRGAAMGAIFILFSSVLADTVDYDELRTGQRREAQFTAFSGLIPKFVSIIAAALPLAVMGAVGYNPATTSLSPNSVLTIRLLFALVPVVFHVFVLVILLRYPISRQVHEAIRNSIQDHQQGREAHDPITGRKLVALSAQTVDEDTSWFLDNFSRHELGRMAADGQKGLAARVFIKFASGALVCLVLIGMAIWLLQGSLSMSQADQLNQGLAACIVIVVGLVLTLTLFHLVRIRAARRMTLKPVDRSIILDHIEQL
jgi:GPH family glycoside/pentoside/hexuronide:cation symporter